MHALDGSRIRRGTLPRIKFKSSQDMVGDLGGILLTSGFFNHSADAFRCSECGTVVIPGTVPGSLDAAGDTP
ncbi:hypothetical protein [Microtetraspora glauca]|uniref:Uncharacterized protein n=1 Tax=Microtetraspora glauca TaxID=1996 RepID=A0ABV3GIJ5_MICGL